MDGAMLGGNMNVVMRVGDTVLRKAGPWTPTIHRYLEHLENAGIDWVPRPLGIDGEREILSFVAGDVPVYPLPEWVWTDEALADASRHLRALHDASIGFAVADALWQLPAHEPAEVICHNDFAPHNLAFSDGLIAGVIDFDTSSPGPRIWDLAYLATRMVPLSADHADGSPGEDQSHRRIQWMLDSYGSDTDWLDVVRVAIVRLRDLAHFSIAKADELGKPELLGHAAMYERDATYLAGVLAVVDV